MLQKSSTTGVCSSRHRGSVLQGDALAGGQSVPSPLVVPQLLQHSRSQEEWGNGIFPVAGQFACTKPHVQGHVQWQKIVAHKCVPLLFLPLQAHTFVWRDTPLDYNRNQGLCKKEANFGCYWPLLYYLMINEQIWEDVSIGSLQKKKIWRLKCLWN